jgi:hypothetical protein
MLCQTHGIFCIVKGVCAVQTARGKTGTLREIQTADAAARNHPADGTLSQKY